MSATSPAIAARLQAVFARVKDRDFTGTADAVREYERDARRTMASSNFSSAKVNNELHVDLLKVLQPIKDLDFAKLKLPAVKLTELKDLVVSLTDQIAVLRENGSLVASAHLEVHLMFILRSLDPIFHHRPKIVAEFHDFSRLRLRQRLATESDAVMGKLEAYVDHVFSLTYNRALKEFKSTPQNSAWAEISQIALKLGVYSKSHLEQMSERVYARFNAFKTSPLLKKSPQLGHSFYVSTIDELICAAETLPNDDFDLSSPARQMKLLQCLTAFALALQYIGECKANNLNMDSGLLRRTLTRLRGAFGAFSEEEVEVAALHECFDMALWALDGSNLSALPDMTPNLASGNRVREIQFYAFLLLPQALASQSEKGFSTPPPWKQNPQIKSILSTSWECCFVTCKPTEQRLMRDATRAFEEHLKCYVFLDEGFAIGSSIDDHLSKIDGWRTENKLTNEIASLSHLDGLGVCLQRNANNRYIAGDYDKATPLYVKATEIYSRRYEGAPPPAAYMQESRLWPCHEFLARSYEMRQQWEKCVDVLAKGLRMLSAEHVFKKAFEKTLAICTKLSKWNDGGSFCQRFFALVDVGPSPTWVATNRPPPMDRFVMMTQELHRWRSAKFNSIDHQRGLLAAMKSMPGLTPDLEIWIAVEEISSDYAAAGVIESEEKYNQLISQLNRIVSDTKRVSNPSSKLRFYLAKAYFLLHVLTTAKLADCIQAKQKAQDAANKSPSTLPSAENPEGEETIGPDLDSCTNFVTVSLQKRTYENLEKCFQILNRGDFEPGDNAHLSYEFLNLVSVMAAYWDLGSSPDRTLSSYLLGLRFARKLAMEEAAATYAGKAAFFCCRYEMYDTAFSLIRDAERIHPKNTLDACQYFQLARAWHAFGIRDHATSEIIYNSLIAKPRALERSILVELMVLRAAQLLTPSASSPYLHNAKTWETPQALLQFAMRLAESVSGQMGKNGGTSAGGNMEVSYIEFIVIVLRIFMTYCEVCDSCEWVRESGLLYKEGFQIAERYGVPHWMANVMLQRVGRDILINAKNEAETRLREAKFVLNSPGDAFLAHLKHTGVLANRKSTFHDASSMSSGGDDDDDDSFALPKVPQMSHHRGMMRNNNNSDEDSSPTRFAQKTASPIFKRTASTAPSFVTHASSCVCWMCEDMVYQKCLLDLMLRHGALLLKQDATAQTIFCADAGFKIHAKLVETWKKKRADWNKSVVALDERRNEDDILSMQAESQTSNEEEPFLEGFWNLKLLKAEAQVLLAKVGHSQATLKPMIDGVDEACKTNFFTSKWSRLRTTTLATAYYLYVVSLGDSLSASEKMMSADWVVLQTPAKTELSQGVTGSGLPGEFDAMLNLGITCRKPSSTGSQSSDSENIPPKKWRVKSEAMCATPNSLLGGNSSTPSALKEAQNHLKPAFFIYADADADKSLSDHKPVKSEGATTEKAPSSVGQAPKKRTTAKSRTARVNLQEPPSALPVGLETNGVEKKPTTPRSVKKPPILSAESFTKAAVASRTPGLSPLPASATSKKSAKTTTTTKSKTKAGWSKKTVPAIAFEMPSSPETSPTEDNADLLDGDKKPVDSRPKLSTRKLRPAPPKAESFISSPEVSPNGCAPIRKRVGLKTSKKEDGATTTTATTTTTGVKRLSPRRKLSESNVDSAPEATSSKRKCGGRRKATETIVEVPDAPASLDAVTQDIGALHLSTVTKTRHATYSKKGGPGASTSTRSTRQKRAAGKDGADSLQSGELVRSEDGNGEDDDALNTSVLPDRPLSPTHTASASSSTTSTTDQSEGDCYSSDDNVFTPGLPRTQEAASDAMNAEVIRKDSPNGQLRPKVKLLAGDAFDSAADDMDDESLVVERFTTKRATSLVEKALDLQAPFPMGYVYRQCAERLVLLKGSEDAVSCSGIAVQSTGLAFRHSCLLNACKFIIREKFGYAEKTADLFHTTSDWLSFKNTPQDVVSRVLEHLPATWKVAQLRVVDATPNLPSIVSKPSASSLLLVTLFTANSLTSNILLPFNPRILDQYTAQLSANLDSIKKGHDNLVSYWEKRDAEDKNMGLFLSTTEQDLLGCWVGLLMGEPSAKKLADAGVDWKKLIQKALALLPELSPVLSNAGDGSLPNILMEAFLKGFFKLQPAYRYDGVQQLVGRSMAILEAHELVKKIEKLLYQTTEKGVKVKTILESFEPVIVVLDGHIQSIPVERFPAFEVNSSMTRLPSTLFFPVVVKHSSIHHQGGVHADKGWYLIDPASNLEGTRERMRIWVEAAFSQWEGVVGKEPDAVHALKQVRTKDVYMYCGHGTGAIFIGRDDVQRDLLRAVCFLIGCSAGLLTSFGGNLEPWGRIIPLIIGCAPAIVSPLWEVTDRDIDIFTQDLLDYWLKATKPSAHISLAKVLDKAAEKLKCKFANGRSCVTYGIPVFRKK